MPVIVGNAIHEYISNARPYSNSPYIFIHHRSPDSQDKKENKGSKMLSFLSI